ncbi:Ig-like domain repeat protein [Methanobrevibacter sp.]
MSLSFVSATQNDTSSNDNDDILSLTDDSLHTEEILSANNDENNTNNDVGTFTELRTALEGNNELILEKDYVAHSSDSQISLERNVEIDGQGHTIDASGVTRIFYTPKDANIDIVLKNLIIKNGYAKRATGGAISFSSDSTVNLVIINCTFINNKADFNAGALEFTPKQGTLEISDSTFKNNHAMHGTGGAIRDAADKTKIINSKFESNTAQGGDGGAVYVSTDSNEEGVEIDNCTFNGNRVLREEAGFNGGAVRAKTAALKITNSNFTDNHVTGKDEGSQRSMFGDMDGGAIESENRLEIGGCYFKDNSAYDCGGAIAAKTIKWLSPCTFIHNHVETWNDIVANKGGAVYASYFENTAKGLIFIDNSGYYGGAVYLRKECDVTFESCYFENNRALTSSSSQGSGAAIYVDSSGSKLSLISNIFVNNAATSDSGVFNCGKYETYTGNWWGTNTPNFGHEKYIVEWHRLQSNDILTDTGYLQAVLKSDKTDLHSESATLTVQIIDSQGQDFTGNLTNLNAIFTTDSLGEFSNKQIHNNRVTISFKPKSEAETVTAKINNQILTITLTQRGDFSWLRDQINAADGVLDLTQDLVYTEELDTMYEGIVINKPIIINGNGHKIDALGKTLIFNIQTNDVTINNVTFVGGLSSMSGAINIEGTNIKILNSNFTDNIGTQYGGAIFARYGGDIQIIGCQFINNTHRYYENGGGAIQIDTPNTKIEKSVFINNTAIREGGAIYNLGENVEIKNSIFLNNKAMSNEILCKNTDNNLIFTLTGFENYMNAIQSEKTITFSNVTYWNGAITTDDNPSYSANESGQTIILEIFDSENRMIKKITLTTNATGQAVFDKNTLQRGDYTFTATHPDDSYYTECIYRGQFNVTGIPNYPSEVKINIENQTQFNYGNCNISFEVTNKTIVEIVIANSDYSQIFYDNETTLNYVILNLPASDEYYNILVFNHGNGTYDPSYGEKSFKILKINSTVTVNPITDVLYTDPVTVTFTGEGTSYNVTVYNENNTQVYSQITDNNSVQIPTALNVGTYNVTVINLGDENRTSSRNSTTFNVGKKDNSISVSINDGYYGDGVTVSISATADGAYDVDLNGTKVVVNVDGGHGATGLELAAGSYTPIVTYDNPNYNNIVEANDFIIHPAQSNVILSVVNITYGENKTINIDDKYPTEYNITIYDGTDTIIFTEIVNNTEFTMPQLDVGQYNITINKLGNENITSSSYTTSFEIILDNYVEIIIDDVEYFEELFIILLADIDGNYTVDINGTELTIEVTDGIGFDNTLELDAGEYYANVTFENTFYNNILENTTFTVYPAISKLQINDIENATYGQEILLEYYDDYPAEFDIYIYDENEDKVFDFTTPDTSILLELPVGKYTAMVTNKGNESVLGTTEFKNFTVNKGNVEFTKAKGHPGRIDVNATADVILSESNATGTVYVTVNGTEYSAELENGAAIITLPLLPIGVHTFDVIYSGDENYENNTAPITVNINKYYPTMKATARSVKVDQNASVNVVLPFDATGTVTITIDETEYTADVINGTATITLPVISKDGSYKFDVIYSGNDEYRAQTTYVTFNVIKYKVTMKATARTVKVGDNVTVNVALPEDATGEASIAIDDKTYTGIVENGAATIVIPDLPIDQYELDVDYSGDDYYKPGTAVVTFNVNKQSTTMKATARTVKVGDNVTVNVVLKDDTTGDVVITVNDVDYTATVEEGIATIVLPDLPAGQYALTVKYSGDDKYKNQSTTVTFNVNKYNVRMKATTKYENGIAQITVTLSDDATGSIYVDISETNYTANVENAKALIEIPDLDAGQYTFDVNYSGDSKYKNYTSTAKLVVPA